MIKIIIKKCTLSYSGRYEYTFLNVRINKPTCMKIKIRSFILLITALFCMSFLFKGGVSKDPEKVIVHALSDLQSLNPFNSTDAQSTITGYLTFQTLYGLDPFTYEYIPVLAKEKGKTFQRDGKLCIDFEIREEAHWDNGEKITAEDLLFSLKILATPYVDCKHLWPYFEYIEDLEINEKNPKKFTVICKKQYMLAESSIADLYFIPKHVYDPKDILSKFSFKELADPGNNNSMKNSEELIKFAKLFNSRRFKYSIQEGSGPYLFDSWFLNQKITFKRKENWWGDKVTENRNTWFDAFPKEITYKIVNDYTTALIQLENGEIDAMSSVPIKHFAQFKSDPTNQKNFFFENPPYFAYDYIGLNLKNPLFEEVKVRKALAYIMDSDKLIEEELFGFGDKTLSFIHPNVKDLYDATLEPYNLDINKAKKLLAEAGWKDKNRDGILEKKINGKKQDFEFSINYNNGNSRRMKTCQIFQENAKKVGIKVNILAPEWANFLHITDKHLFDAYVGGWVASPVESTPKQIWHSDSYYGGSNYVGFGDATSDAIIDKMEITPNREDRIPLYKALQQKINEEVPYIFLVTQNNRVVLSKKFQSCPSTGLRSGIMPALIKLAE